jgi:hypothetical protein
MPWDFKPASPIPETVRTDKKLRDVWIENPTTEHHVYTFFEGINNRYRITAPNADGEGNPVRAMHALVADYDHHNTSKEEVMRKIERTSWKPNWVERTLSGNWRFVWLLEKPLLFPSHSFAKHFLQTFPQFAFDPSLFLVAFDRSAWEAPERLYVNSCEWHHIHDKPIPEDISRGWLVKASEKFGFDRDEFGIAIPLDVMKPKLEEKYPRFIDWPGEFSLNSQGPSFWVDGSVSPKSAIVRDTGMQTFSDHAAKAFYSWAELVGIDFCRAYEAEAIGRAVKEIYHDSRLYWRKLASSIWRGYEKADIVNHLVTKRGVSVSAKKKGPSEVQRCIEYIQSEQGIQGAAPCIYLPEGLIPQHGELPLLNTSNVRPMAPAQEKGVWGLHGGFPWLSSLMDAFFSSPDQLPYWLAHHAYAYQAALNGEPCSGQAVIIIGGTGTGKTLLGSEVFGRTLGGSIDAQRYLMGEDKFGSQLFHVPVWLINDATVSTDPKKFRFYTETVKKAVANCDLEYHKKFAVPTMVKWLGRIFITGNDDEESIRIIPNLGQSILDKLMLFRAVHETKFKFPSMAEIKRILDRELPAYCAYLRDYKIHDDLVGDSRFGIECYHEPSLVRSSNQSSENAGFGEILEDWKQFYFETDKPEAKFWKGTAFQLLKELNNDPRSEAVVRRLSVDGIGRHLAGLKNKGVRIEVDDSGTTRKWIIFKDENEAAVEKKAQPLSSV